MSWPRDRVAAVVDAMNAAGIKTSLFIDADAPQFTKVDPPATGATMAGVRVTTGTIPDYTTEAKGLLLAGVIGGGPAEKAGLMKGDVSRVRPLTIETVSRWSRIVNAPNSKR